MANSEDSFDGRYLESRAVDEDQFEQAQDEEMFARHEREKQAAKLESAAPWVSKIPDDNEEFGDRFVPDEDKGSALDSVQGFLADLPRNSLGGAALAVDRTAKAFFGPALLPLDNAYRKAFPELVEAQSRMTDWLMKNDSVDDAITREAVSFILPTMMWARAAHGVGQMSKLGTAVFADAVAGYSAIEPGSETFAGMLQGGAASAEKILAETDGRMAEAGRFAAKLGAESEFLAYVADKEGNPDIENRLKNVIDGGVAAGAVVSVAWPLLQV